MAQMVTRQKRAGQKRADICAQTKARRHLRPIVYTLTKARTTKARTFRILYRVVDNLPRTNNSVEAWHQSFQQTVDCHHPSVYKLVEHFRKEQDHCELKVKRYRSGFRQPESSKAKYVR